MSWTQQFDAMTCRGYYSCVTCGSLLGVVPELQRRLAG